MRSKRSAIAHRDALAPASVPSPMYFFFCASSGISQPDSGGVCRASTSFRCAGDGAPTSLRGIRCALIVVCMSARNVAVYIRVSESKRN